MRSCDYEALDETARREGNAARGDLWMALLVLVLWTVTVATVAAQLAGGVQS